MDKIKVNQSNQTSQEKLSALLDDEVSVAEQEELLSAVASDPDLCATWQRYHLIGAAVRREVIIHLPGLPDRIAPMLRSNVAPIRTRPSKKTAAGRWLPGLALAASVAGLGSLGLFGLLPQSDVREASNPVHVAEVEPGTRWNSDSPDHQHTLNAYLVEHGEFTPMPNMGGLMAYAKFVSYDADH